jgi:hypothetical protein
VALPPTGAPARDGRLSGTGRVTLARTGGGAGPDWGAYAPLYTTRLLDGRLEAIVAAAPPQDTDPAWGLHHPRPYGPTGSATRSLWAYATAANTAQAKSENPAAYEQRLATYLLRTAFSARMTPPPHVVDLAVAQWEIRTERVVTLAKAGTPGYAGHFFVRIGRILSVLDKSGGG